MVKIRSKFRTITENSADAIFITDKAGKYLYVNNKAVELLGYSKEEFLTFTIADISPKSRLAEYIQNFQQLINTGSSYSEIELIRKDGSFVETDLNAVQLPNGLIYGSCRDISGRKLLEAELIKAKERAEESDRLKSISKAYVEMLGGKLWVENNADYNRNASGATFFFTIPVHPVKESKNVAIPDKTTKNEFGKYKKCVNSVNHSQNYVTVLGRKRNTFDSVITKLQHE